MNFASKEVRACALAIGEWVDGRADASRLARFGLVGGGNELRAMGVGEASAGATLVDSHFHSGFFAGMDQTNVLRNEATLLVTDDGGVLHVPMFDDVEVDAVILPENAEAASADVSVSEMTLDCHNIHSRIVKMSRELFVDGGPHIQRHIGTLLGRRAGRKAGKLFVSGTGVGEPTGVLTASTQSVDADEVSINYEELVELRYGRLNSAYQSGAKWLMSPETLGLIRKVYDDSSRPVLEGDLLFGREVILCDAMPSVAAESRPIVFGALGAYAVREIGVVMLKKYVERFASTDQIGLAAVLRTDGNLLDPKAIAHLQMPAA